MERTDDHGSETDEPHLGDVALDHLVHEVLSRVRAARDEETRLRLLLDVVTVMAAELTLDGVLDQIVYAASRLVGARYAALGVLAGDGERLRTFVHHGMDAEVVRRVGDLPTGEGLLGLLIDDPRPIRLHDISTHPSSSGFPEHHPPMSTFLGVPIRIRGQVYGNLHLTEKIGGSDFTEHDEAVALALAAAAGVAIENAQLYEEGERRQAWLEATLEITSLLADDSAADAALQLVADRARLVSGADVSWIVLASPGGHLQLDVVSGVPVDRPVMHQLSMDRSLASIVVRTGEPISVEDVARDPRAVDPSSIPGWPALGPVMVLPLGTSRGIVGVLSLGWTVPHAEAFRQVDRALPASFAEQATLAIQVARGRDDRQRLTLFEERDRIARDLHDTVVQQLFAVGLGLQSIANLTSDHDVGERIERAIGDLDGTIKDIRRTIFALGTHYGATDAQREIEGIVDRATATMKLRPRLRIDGPVRSAVPPDLAHDLLAVLSEGLANVARHAEASTVDVHVRVDDDTVTVIVTDDGRGLGTEIRESGLANLRRRAHKYGGELVLESHRDGGTTLTWKVPFDGPTTY